MKILLVYYLEFKSRPKIGLIQWKFLFDLIASFRKCQIPQLGILLFLAIHLVGVSVYNENFTC